MVFEEGVKILLAGANCFHGNFKQMFGQIALRLDENTYLTTGENKKLASIVEKDITLCDISTGDLGQIFSNRQDINAFIFGCSQDTVEASKDKEYLDVALDDMAHLAGAHLKIVENAEPKTLLEALNDTCVCLVKGTGAIAACEDMWMAAAAMQVIEKTCEACAHGEMIGGVKPIVEDVANSLKENFENKYLPTNKEKSVEFIGFDEDSFAIRNDLTKTCATLIDEDLVYGSWGNVSVKMDDETMLITPSSINNSDIKIEDLVRVNLSSLETMDPREPSGNAELYARMYKELPGCNAIIHTHSNACSVFAACEAGFAITDEKMKQLIGDVLLIPYNPADTIASNNRTLKVLQDTHAAIQSHQGAIFYGPSLEVVTEIAIAVEKLAQKLLKFDATITDEEE